MGGGDASDPELAHNATRVVICRRWVITSLRPRLPPASSPSRSSPRDTGKTRSVCENGPRRTRFEKARLADLIVNRGRQNTRVGSRAPTKLSRNFDAPWKKVAQDTCPRMARCGQDTFLLRHTRTGPDRGGPAAPASESI